jgi:hypothetical protein
MLSATTANQVSQQPKSRLSNLSNQVSQIAAPAPAPLSTPEASAAVLSTMDYNIFKTIDSNRPVVEAHVRHLMEQIGQKDLLHLRPIDVNADFGVVDGQHRLEAARRLGRPIYYQVSQLTDDDMAALNRASRNWKNTDYLHYWVRKGNPHYVALADFMARHPQVILSSAQQLLTPQSVRLAAQFREGLYQVEDMERAEKVMVFLDAVASEAKYKFAHDVRFITAIMWSWTRVKGFDPDTLLRKILLQPTELVRCATLGQFMTLLERLYNYKTTEKLQVRFR